MRTTYLLQEKQLDGSTCLVETTAKDWHAIVQACAKLPTDQRRYFKGSNYTALETAQIRYSVKPFYSREVDC